MIFDFLVENGFEILGLDFFFIKGFEGNIEYLIYLRNGNEGYEFDGEIYNNKIVEVVEVFYNLDK